MVDISTLQNMWDLYDPRTNRKRVVENYLSIGYFEVYGMECSV